MKVSWLAARDLPLVGEDVRVNTHHNAVGKFSA